MSPNHGDDPHILVAELAPLPTQMDNDFEDDTLVAADTEAQSRAALPVYMQRGHKRGLFDVTE